jgi:secreted trypsin-like serine protease
MNALYRKTLTLALAAGLLIFHAGISQSASVEPSLLDKLKEAERAAAQKAPAGSIQYNVERNANIRSVMESLGTSGRSLTLPVSAGVPSVNNDPRFDNNLVSMAQQTISNEHARIFGGGPIAAGTFRDVVSLSGSYNLRCSGTLIAANVVLTAAHCVCAGVNKQVTFGEDTATALSTDVFDVVRSTAMNGCSSGVNAAVIKPGEDVALVYLDKSVTTIAPRAFASITTLNAASEIRAVGYGLTETGRIGTKLMVDIPMASPTCSGFFNGVADSNYYKCAAGLESVAGMQGLKRDTCTGDSGGPILILAADNSYALAGVTSRGVGSPGAANCGDGGIYELPIGDIFSWITVTNHVPVKTI